MAAVVQENVPFTESEDNYATAMTLTMVYSETCKYSLFFTIIIAVVEYKDFYDINSYLLLTIVIDFLSLKKISVSLRVIPKNSHW